MKTIEYRTIDKTSWGEGPWQSEPDKVQWQDPEPGLPCLIVRSPTSGSLCGYAGVPSTHPAHGLHYDGPPAPAMEKYQKAISKRMKLAMKLKDGGAEFMDAIGKAWEGAPERPEADGVGQQLTNISVHGGLTFSGPCQKHDDPSRHICHLPDEGEPDDIHWFGFDTAHAGDFMPVMDAWLKEAGRPSWRDRDDQYRDIAYVKAEVTALAKQLAGIQRLLAPPV